MNKLTIIAISVVIAGIASADLLVNVKNASGLLKAGEIAPGPSTIVPAGSLFQLVWSADGAGYQTDNLALSLVNPGEYILFSGAVNPAGTFQFGSMGWADDSVGGVDINTGSFYARFFDQVAPVDGASFVEAALTLATLDGDKAFPAPDKTYNFDLNNLGLVSVDAQGTTVIPEPATLGMMAVAGLGMFLARKKARR